MSDFDYQAAVYNWAFFGVRVLWRYWAFNIDIIAFTVSLERCTAVWKADLIFDSGHFILDRP